MAEADSSVRRVYSSDGQIRAELIRIFSSAQTELTIDNNRSAVIDRHAPAAQRFLIEGKRIELKDCEIEGTDRGRHPFNAAYCSSMRFAIVSRTACRPPYPSDFQHCALLQRP